MANPLYDRLLAPLAGRQTALLHLPEGRTITGDAFLCMAHRFAGAMRAAGVGPGDRMAFQVAKSPEALAIYAGTLALGAICLPLNPAYTPAEVDYFVANASPRLLIGDPGQAEALAAIARAHAARFETMGPDGFGSFSELARACAPLEAAVERSHDDLAALLYTSGTTGRSKGAMLSQGNLLSNAVVLAETWRFGPDDVLLHALPIFHSHGLFVATNVVLETGGAMIFLPGFETGAVLSFLSRATTMMGVPTFYTRLLADPRFDRASVRHMRLFVSGSAPLLADTHRAFEGRTGHRILERYGLTETSMNTSNPYDGARRAGTVGLPLPGIDVVVTDPASRARMPAGEVGMIEVRGPNVFSGYWQMPEKTAEALRPDGFFITGDLGRIETDGYLSIVGREKDLIITGGLNVYPKELELVLDAQPGVLESAVVGVPHPDFGEAVLAVVVPQPFGAPDLGAIAEALARQLARFKQPKAIETLPELPRNTMGKVQKAELRARFADWFRTR